MKSPIRVEGWRYLLTAVLLAISVMVKQGSPVIAQDDPGVCTSYAVWANSTTADAALAIPGNDNVIGGDAHSNAGVTIRGNANALHEVEYVTEFEEPGNDNAYTAVEVDAAPLPFPFDIEAYRPGGPVADVAQVTGDYTVIEGDFEVRDNDVVLDGLYYVTGDVELRGNNLTGTVTIVAEGEIQVRGNNHALVPYVDNLLFVSNEEAADDSVIWIASSDNVLGGILFAPGGLIELSGSGNLIEGAVVGDRVLLNGNDLRIEPSCPAPATLDLVKSVSAESARPGDVLIYTLTLQNQGLETVESLFLTDPIPTGTHFVADSLSTTWGAAQYSTEENQIIWSGDVDPEQTVTIAYRVTVDEGIGDGAVIVNTATIDAFDLSASTETTVAVEGTSEGGWVFLVYLAADNDLDDPEFNVIQDWKAFNALEQAALKNPDLQIYVQWDRSPDTAGDFPGDHTRRYRVLPDANPFALATYSEGANTWDLGEANMGDPQVLYEFLTWARSHYDNRQEAIAIVGHGGGWSPTLEPALGYPIVPAGIVWDDSSGDYLSTKELGQALFWATGEQADSFDLLYLQGSMMAMVENAYEVRGSADYLVASEGAMWASFAYDVFLADVDAATTPRQLAEHIVSGYAASLEGYPLTLAGIAIDLTAMSSLREAVDALALALLDILPAERAMVEQAYLNVQKFDSNWDLVIDAPDAYVDLYDLAYQLDQLAPDSATALHASAQAVMAVWANVVVAEIHHDGQPWLNPSTTWHFDGAHGLAIYLPLAEDFWLRDHYRDASLALAVDTHWDEFIHNGWYAGTTPPAVNTRAQAVDPAGRAGLLSVQQAEQQTLYLPVLSRN